MSTKKTVKETDFTANLHKFFGTTFFQEPEILNLSENSFSLHQTTLTSEPNGGDYIGSDQFKFLTTLQGKIIRNLSAEKPKIFGNQLFFEKPLQTLTEHFGENNVNVNFQKIDDYSGTMIIGIRTMAKEISKGDILNPAIIFKNSLTGIFKPGINFCFDRVWCSNGARRKEVISLDDLNTDLLATSEQWINNILEGHTQIEYNKLLEMQNKTLKNSFLEKNITEEINAMGFHKKWNELAHYQIHREVEELNVPLNAFLAYNGFNKILFENQETSLNLDKKEKLDEKIFDYLLNVS